MGSLLRLQADRNAYTVALIAAYALTHLLFLTRLPIFIDEAVNINRAEDIFESFHNFKNYGLWDGKWLTVKIMGVFLTLPVDPLLSMRLSAVLFGASTVVASVAIGRMLFSWREGLLAGGLFALLPYTFFINRVAVSDNYLVAFGACVLLLSITVVRSTSRAYMALLAIAMIASILSKLSGVVLMMVPVLAALVLTPPPEWRRSLLRVSPALLSGVVVLGILIWKGSGTTQVGERATILDLAGLAHNIGLASDWFWSLLTPPLAIVAVLAAIAALQIRERRYTFLTLVALGAVVPFVLLTRGIAPRYFLFAVLPTSLLLARLTLISGSYTMSRISSLRSLSYRRTASVAMAVGAMALLIWPVLLSATILFRPEKAKLPGDIRSQFVTGRGAGYGLTEMAEYLEGRAAMESHGINVLRFRFWGALLDGLDVYLSQSESLEIYDLDASSPDLSIRTIPRHSLRLTFLVLHPPTESDDLGRIGSSLEPYLLGAHRVWRYPKPGGEYGLEVWELSRSGSVSPRLDRVKGPKL